MKCQLSFTLIFLITCNPTISRAEDEITIYDGLTLENRTFSIPENIAKVINTTINEKGQLTLVGGNPRILSAQSTTINSGGTLFLVANGSSASDVVVNNGGFFHAVHSGGISDVVINDGGRALLNYMKFIDGLTIAAGGSAEMAFSKDTAPEVTGLKLLQGGYLRLNNDSYTSQKYFATINDAYIGGVVHLSNTTKNNDYNVNFKRLQMDEGNIIFDPTKPNKSTLRIGNLSGIGSFAMNTSLADRTSDFIHVDHGTGRFGLIVNDSGRDITDHDDLTINLVNEVSGDASFELLSSSGQRTPAIDGGTYMYTLHRAQDKDGLSGKVWYLGVMTDEPDEGGDQGGGGDGGDQGGGGDGGDQGGGDGGDQGGGGDGGDQGGGGDGGDQGGGGDSGDQGGGGESGDQGGGGDSGDQGGGGDSGDQGGGGDGGDQGGGGDGGDQGGGNHYRPVTTPATDAVLALSSAPLGVLHSELEGFRAGYRSLSPDRGGAWGHFLGNKNHVNISNGATYRLSQSGFELGSDIATIFTEGVIRTGLFMTQTGNEVRHERGGKSRIESWGIGTYATWYDQTGFYVDGVIKGSRLNNKLNAVMTNGGGVSGRWDRYGVSTALEAGFPISMADYFYAEPYVRVTGIYVNDIDVKLSNGMKANTGKSRSLETELGSRFSKNLIVGKTSVKPYIHAALIQEMATSNETVINQKHRFSNNTNGTRGRYGAGVSAELVRDTHLYADLSYSNGRYTESPIQSLVGISTTF